MALYARKGFTMIKPIKITKKASVASRFDKLKVKAQNFFLQLKTRLAQTAIVMKLTQLMSSPQISMFLNQLKVNSPMLRVGILAFLLVGIPGILSMPEECHAQTANTISLEKVATNAFDTFYKKWRWPICGLLMLAAIGAYIFAGDQGKGIAIGISVGILGWALVPYFIKTFKQWTGDSSGTDGGGGGDDGGDGTTASIYFSYFEIG
jgi:hypothetical protein